jgi:FixJ family two-component response regulator
MFWSRLSKREKAMVQFVAEGKPLRKAARALRVSSSAVKNTKRDLALKLLDFMGADILVQVQRSPWWKKDLQAIQAKMACREERRR